MQTNIIATVTPEGNIELPPEIREKVQAGEKFVVTLTEDTITLKKTNKFDWEELRRRREELGDEQEEMSIEEICEIVREVRRENSKS